MLSDPLQDFLRFSEISLNLNVKKIADYKLFCIFAALIKNQLYNEKDNLSLNGNSSYCSLQQK